MQLSWYVVRCNDKSNALEFRLLAPRLEVDSYVGNSIIQPVNKAHELLVFFPCNFQLTGKGMVTQTQFLKFRQQALSIAHGQMPRLV